MVGLVETDLVFTKICCKHWQVLLLLLLHLPFKMISYRKRIRAEATQRVFPPTSPPPPRQMISCILINICCTSSRSTSHMKQAVTRAQAGKLSLNTRPSIQPTEQQMNESAVKAGVCLALCGGSAITTSAAVHPPQRGGLWWRVRRTVNLLNSGTLSSRCYSSAALLRDL